MRGSTVNAAEPGQITQHIGASFVPSSVIKSICGNLLTKLNIDIIIPGLLFIDTPGHEAFITLRKRGGSVADLAILVVDINEGFQPQTDESLEFLKQFKTPFIVAATKVDLIYGWKQNKTTCFKDSFTNQSDSVQDELEAKIYNIVSQLYERGFEAERFDRITDFKKQVAIVPCSGKTGEGISELLVMLSGLAQRFLKDKLELSDKAMGNVLEVKEVKGLGATIDAIIYDGSISVGDTLIVGSKNGCIVTKIKALLRPPELKELRMEKKFDFVKQVSAAAGIKIAAPGLDNAIAGSPIICVSDEAEIEEAKKIIEQEIDIVEFNKDIDGVLAKADTIGSLEALVKILTDNQIPIKKAEIGHVTKQDVVEIDVVKDPEKKVILCFNVDLLQEAEDIVRDKKIPVFKNNIIYRIVEDYKKWRDDKKEREKTEKLESAIRPAKIRIIPGFVFRNRQPAIVGVEVLAGVLKVNTPVCHEDKRDVGKIKQIQKDGKNVNQIKTGDKAAISMDEPTVGRQIEEGDILISVITPHNLKILTEVWDKLQDDEKQLLRDWGMV
ncbi:MAG: translation initiation factor IF-2 [Candidatus Aenigmatarchaeota archaeon]